MLRQALLNSLLPNLFCLAAKLSTLDLQRDPRKFHHSPITTHHSRLSQSEYYVRTFHNRNRRVSVLTLLGFSGEEAATEAKANKNLIEKPRLETKLSRRALTKIAILIEKKGEIF